ncbi:hypothetical protein [Sphaerisporangium fuscum]|uniref:hypothetical protein n=1 Tax=Sphaerisporangium fuscum TaxID=2835868 RepID=UPI001BDC640F|nr:hypothetical protein [Sphaerisporangium fuscum]
MSVTAAGRVERITAQLPATLHDDVAAWSTTTRLTAAVVAALSIRFETTGKGPVTEVTDLLV